MRSNLIPIDDSPPEVNVQRLVFSDWDNYAEAAIHERERILNADLPGCWYINPISCVRSPDPVNEFFEEVERRQGAWCQMLDRHLGKGWRTIRKQTKNQYQRGVEFEGVLILNGQRALPEDIPEIRRLLGQLPTVIRRHQAFRLLKQRKLDELKILTDEELTLRQNSDRSAEGYAYFILPHATVESRFVTAAFIHESNLRKREWYRSVSHLFPKKERRCFEEDGSTLEAMSREHLLVGGQRNSWDSLRPVVCQTDTARTLHQPGQRLPATAESNPRV